MFSRLKKYFIYLFYSVLLSVSFSGNHFKNSLHALFPLPSLPLIFHTATVKLLSLPRQWNALAKVTCVLKIAKASELPSPFILFDLIAILDTTWNVSFS